MKIILLTIIVGFLSIRSMPGQSIIADRLALNAILGAQRINEGFETYNQNGGASKGPGIMTAADWDGVPNLVVSGITLRSTYPSSDLRWIQWNGNGFNGNITQTIYSSGSLMLEFEYATSAFGIDLKDHGFERECFTAGVTVYAADRSTILYTVNTLNLTDPTGGLFFGYQSPSGIGAVEFFTVVGADPGDYVPHIFSPKIDNLSFAVPEPSTFAFALLGLSTLAFRFCKMQRE